MNFSKMTTLLCFSFIFLHVCSSTLAENIKIFPTADARVEEEDPNKNFGASTVLTVKSKVSDNKRIYIKFDLPKLPENTMITSAKLKLFMYDAPGVSRTYEIFRVTQDWEENLITWNSQPHVENVSSSFVESGKTANVWLEWDVYSDVKGFYQNKYQNFGWLIKDKIENSTIGREGLFRSRENVTFSPILEINYSKILKRFNVKGTNGSIEVIDGIDVKEYETQADYLSAIILRKDSDYFGRIVYYSKGFLTRLKIPITISLIVHDLNCEFFTKEKIFCEGKGKLLIKTRETKLLRINIEKIVFSSWNDSVKIEGMEDSNILFRVDGIQIGQKRLGVYT